MKSLIRPFLFTIARLGFFLVVTAWIVGQWWYVHFNFPAPGGGCFLSTSPSGLVVGHYQDPLEWQCRIIRVPDSNRERRQLGVFDPTELPFGISFMWNYGPVIAISHWLTTFIFLAFNILLHIIYHKRSERQPCDD